MHDTTPPLSSTPPGLLLAWRLLMAALIVTALVGLLGPKAGAAEPGVNPDSTLESITLDASVIAIVSGFIIPVLTALLTKMKASSQVKATTALVLAAASATFTNVVVAGNGTFEPKTLVVYFFLTLGPAITGYVGVVKPYELSKSLAPGTGLGGGTPPG